MLNISFFNFRKSRLYFQNISKKNALNAKIALYDMIAFFLNIRKVQLTFFEIEEANITHQSSGMSW